MAARVLMGSMALHVPGNAAANVVRSVSVDIPAQSMATALLHFSEQTGIQITAQGATLQVLNTSGVRGDYPIAQALEILLRGSGLTYKFVDDETVVVRRVLPDSVSSAAGNGADGLLLAQGQTRAVEKKTEQPRSGTGTPRDASEVILEEITVTATKREERVQDVPMSIAVIGNQDIERRGLTGMEDYLRSIPGVNQIDQGPLGNAIVIRGITTSPQSENFGTGTTVATYFDETSITGAGGLGQGGIDVRPVDIERIEVLRGPQGTAFGSSSLAGTVRIIPARPKLDSFSAGVTASYSNTGGNGSDNSMIQGVLNVPVIADKLALRAVGYRYDESGFYRNLVGTDPASIAVAETYGLGDFVRGYIRDDVGHMVSTGGRLAALWQPTERLDLSVNLLTQRIEQDGQPSARIGMYDQAIYPITPDHRLRGEAGDVVDTKIDLLNAVVNYDLGWAGLTSVASWVDSGGAYAIGGSRTYFLRLSSSYAPSDFKSFSAETRLASKLAGPFQFLGGLYYENVDNDYTAIQWWPGTLATAPGGTIPLVVSETTRQLEQRALFGEVSYDLTSRLRATAGGRYFKYEKSERSLLEGGGVGIALGAGVPVNLNNDENSSSLKAGLDFKPTKDTLLYISWAQGFRLGRPDPGAIPTVCDTNGDGRVDATGVSIESTRSVNSDFLDNYEVGSKLALFDRHLVIDASVYHIKWDGLPVRISAGGTCAYITNAGSATSDGVEFQASLFVANGLRLDFGGGYVKAELAEDATSTSGQAWHKGDRLPGAPKVSANIGAQYEFEVAGHKAFVRADSFYTGKFYGDLLESASTMAGDYIKIDARAGIGIKNLSVELFVRNLTNEDAFTWRSTSPGTIATSPFFGYRMRPRTLGVQLGYSFR